MYACCRLAPKTIPPRRCGAARSSGPSPHPVQEQRVQRRAEGRQMDPARPGDHCASAAAAAAAGRRCPLSPIITVCGLRRNRWTLRRRHKSVSARSFTNIVHCYRGYSLSNPHPHPHPGYKRDIYLIVFLCVDNCDLSTLIK